MMLESNKKINPDQTFTTSPVLTGLWQVADMERNGRKLNLEEAAKALLPYVEAGMTSFDMADHYGSAELIAGVLQKKYLPKGKVQLLTKWVPPPGKVSKQAVREAVQLALDRMQLEQLDLLQYHAWNYADPAWIDQLFWLQELKEEGLIRHLGLTNFDTAHLRMAVHSGIQVVSNQICFSLLDQRAQNGMLNLCQSHGIKILAFGTLAGGFLSEKWLDQPEPSMDQLKTWSQMKYKRFIDQTGSWKNFQELLHTLKTIAQTKKVSIANIASRYILDQPGVGGIVIGARPGRSSHIEDNLKLISLQLSRTDKASIKHQLKTLKTIPGDCGDEYRKPPFLTASGDLSHHLETFPAPYPVKEKPGGEKKIFSGTIWEDLAGYCRGVKKGNRILISGTTATHGDRAIGGNDPAAQTHFIIDKIAGTLQSLGSRLEDVVRTRIFINNVDDWEPVARAHGERFKNIQPANTLVQAKLIGSEYLVEIEAEAIVE